MYVDKIISIAKYLFAFKMKGKTKEGVCNTFRITADTDICVKQLILNSLVYLYVIFHGTCYSYRRRLRQASIRVLFRRCIIHTLEANEAYHRFIHTDYSLQKLNISF